MNSEVVASNLIGSLTYLPRGEGTFDVQCVVYVFYAYLVLISENDCIIRSLFTFPETPFQFQINFIESGTLISSLSGVSLFHIFSTVNTRDQNELLAKINYLKNFSLKRVSNTT
jgi:hypothetical protein